ncbi:Bilirubin oxidase [Thalassotalea sp. ND16A]|nr:Bilirubin oxidase [Thalassotalea sp. ND16A]
MPNRRDFLKQGTVVGGVVSLSSISLYSGKLSLLGGKAHAKEAEPPPSPIPEGWQPFTQNLQAPLRLIPVPLDPPPGTGELLPEDGIGAQVGSEAVSNGIAQEFFDKRFNLSREDVPEPYKQNLITYQLTMREFMVPMFGDGFPKVPKVGYFGLSDGVLDGEELPMPVPAPNSTIIARFKQPIVVRVTSRINVEASVHLHGGHNPAHSDGFPDFYVLENQTRDYFYPNCVPRHDGDLSRYDNFDLSEVPSTLWYHDHGMDATGFNVSRGLAGYYLVTDELERELMNPEREGGQVLPNLETDYGVFDIPLALSDQRLNPDYTLHYDFLDHNGRLGDLFTVNGFVQPVLKVQRRKYRFRILNASNARWYTIRLSDRQPFLLVATDSWLLPEVQRHRKLTLSNGARRDIIVDFSKAPNELFLENIMEQEDGRGPKRINPKAKVRLMKFEVEEEGDEDVKDNLVIAEGTKLRPHVPLNPDDVQITRTFELERRNGAWQINDKWFSPRRADAVPALEQTERWIFKNKSGGWSHPMHVHLAAAQVQKVNGRKPPADVRFNSDLLALRGGDEFEILIRFSTFTGPFVFHCHNLEHEDMRMMGVFDPRPVGYLSPLDGKTAVDSSISGLEHEPDDDDVFEDLDLSPIEHEGVGHPHGDFEAGGGGVAPSPDEKEQENESGDDRRSKRNPRGG